MFASGPCVVVVTSTRRIPGRRSPATQVPAHREVALGTRAGPTRSSQASKHRLTTHRPWRLSRHAHNIGEPRTEKMPTHPPQCTHTHTHERRSRAHQFSSTSWSPSERLHAHVSTRHCVPPCPPTSAPVARKHRTRRNRAHNRHWRCRARPATTPAARAARHITRIAPIVRA